MTIGMNLRKALSGSTLALAMAIAVVTVPFGAEAKTGTAPAGVTVCNTANGGGKDGNMVVDGQLDTQAPVHDSSGLREKQGGKNINAAEHSRALALCYVPYNGASTDQSGDGGTTTPIDPGTGTGGSVDIT